MDGDETVRVNWRRLEVVGVGALATVLLCVFLGQSAKDYASQFAEPVTQTAQMQPRFNAIDYATTASLKSGIVVIGPCDTHKP